MVRDLLLILALALLVFNAWLGGYNAGHEAGYGTAMADVYLGIKSPEQFFKGANHAGRRLPN